MTVQSYLDLITSEYQGQPNFTAVITSGISPLVQIQDLLTSMIPIFDLDEAIGNQLDIIGQWVGFSRTLAVPITGVFFSWDGTDTSLGWDSGQWQDPLSPAAVTSLTDDVYRIFIKAKILANSWDGTTDGAYAIWDAAFPDTSIAIVDGLDMTYRIAFFGFIDALTTAVIVSGALPLKPEGVLITEYLFPIGDNPMFAWDLDTLSLQGWDEGYWPVVLDPT